MSETFRNTIHGLIIDMDGVLWRGEQQIGDLKEVFSTIKKRGLKTVLATNNATRSVEQYHHKLNKFGVTLDEWQIINSSMATGHYLSDKFPDGGSIFIVGEEALIETLDHYGFKNSATGDNVIAVVAALDRTINYEKLKRATLLIRRGIPFIGTNPDRTYPDPDGLVPGSGAILASLQASTDVEPIVIGKPAPLMYQFALERLNMEPKETLVIGDRLETDIRGAQVVGCHTGLVLSGVSTKEMAITWEPSVDLIADDLTSLLRYL